MSQTKEHLSEEIKNALKGGNKQRLGTLRLVLAAIKQKEIDQRKELDEQDIVQVLTQLAKQRRESIEQYTMAQRDDLRKQEEFELAVIHEFLPEQLDEGAVQKAIAEAIEQTQASTIKDLGAVMKVLQAKLQGRADMKQASQAVRALLDPKA